MFSLREKLKRTELSLNVIQTKHLHLLSAAGHQISVVIKPPKVFLTLDHLKNLVSGFPASFSPCEILYRLGFFFLIAILLIFALLAFICGLFQGKQVMLINGSLAA